MSSAPEPSSSLPTTAAAPSQGETIASTSAQAGPSVPAPMSVPVPVPASSPPLQPMPAQSAFSDSIRPPQNEPQVPQTAESAGAGAGPSRDADGDEQMNGTGVSGQDDTAKAADADEAPKETDFAGLLSKRDEEEKKKDKSLAELLAMLDTYRPVIPEEVTDYYLQRSGFESHDDRLNRLLAISAEKFISDIVSDAYQYSRIRQNATSGRPAGGGAAAAAAGGMAGLAAMGGTDKARTVLTMDDLSAALGEYGINAKRSDTFR